MRKYKIVYNTNVENFPLLVDYYKMTIYITYRIHEYEYRITRLQNMIEEEAGFPVSLERAPNGAIIVPPELFQKMPNIRQYD